jgi:hypothetical protein
MLLKGFPRVARQLREGSCRVSTWSLKEMALRWGVRLGKLGLVLAAAASLSVFLPELYAEREKPHLAASLSSEAARLVGTWEVCEAKEPGQPYRPSVRGRCFSSGGPEAFGLVIEYRHDGTFSRLTRDGSRQHIDHGTWSLSGHELRLASPQGAMQAVLYVRLDDLDRFTAVEVHEETPEPGLFVRYRRAEPRR